MEKKIMGMRMRMIINEMDEMGWMDEMDGRENENEKRIEHEC